MKEELPAIIKELVNEGHPVDQIRESLGYLLNMPIGKIREDAARRDHPGITRLCQYLIYIDVRKDYEAFFELVRFYFHKED